MKNEEFAFVAIFFAFSLVFYINIRTFAAAFRIV